MSKKRKTKRQHPKRRKKNIVSPKEAEMDQRKLCLANSVPPFSYDDNRYREQIPLLASIFLISSWKDETNDILAENGWGEYQQYQWETDDEQYVSQSGKRDDSFGGYTNVIENSEGDQRIAIFLNLPEEPADPIEKIQFQLDSWNILYHELGHAIDFQNLINQGCCDKLNPQVLELNAHKHALRMLMQSHELILANYVWPMLDQFEKSRISSVRSAAIEARKSKEYQLAIKKIGPTARNLLS